MPIERLSYLTLSKDNESWVNMENNNKLMQSGLIGGLGLSSLHFIWIVLIILGWAQPLMDFIFKLHMLNSPFQVQPFDWMLALGLLILTFAVGAFGGLIISFLKGTLSD